MKLFDLVDDLPVPSAEARTIKEFNRLITRDRGSEGDAQGRKKKKALKELAFVHWYCTFDSRFEQYDDEKARNEAIINAVGLPEDWEPDADVKLAIERYDDMLVTESMHFVKSLRIGLNKIQQFINEVTMIQIVTNNDGDDYEKLSYDPKNLQQIIKEAPKTLVALNEAKKEVEKELQDKFGGNSKKIRAMVNSFANSSEIEGRI